MLQLPPQLVVLYKVITGSGTSAGHELATWSTPEVYLLKRYCLVVAELCQDEMDRRVAAQVAQLEREGLL